MSDKNKPTKGLMIGNSLLRDWATVVMGTRYIRVDSVWMCGGRDYCINGMHVSVDNRYNKNGKYICEFKYALAFLNDRFAKDISFDTATEAKKYVDNVLRKAAKMKAFW
jgi:hypothetical protein